MGMRPYKYDHPKSARLLDTPVATTEPLRAKALPISLVTCDLGKEMSESELAG